MVFEASGSPNVPCHLRDSDFVTWALCADRMLRVGSSMLNARSNTGYSLEWRMMRGFQKLEDILAYCLLQTRTAVGQSSDCHWLSTGPTMISDMVEHLCSLCHPCCHYTGEYAVGKSRSQPQLTCMHRTTAMSTSSCDYSRFKSNQRISRRAKMPRNSRS